MLLVPVLLKKKNILTGDLGFSFYYRQPVLSVILDRVPATLQLIVPSLIFSAVIGILFFFSSRRRHTRCYRDWSSDVCSSDLSGRTGARVRRCCGLVRRV